MSCKENSIEIAEEEDNLEKSECECESSCECCEGDGSSAEKLEAELKETKELLLRTAAEYNNFRKRSEREKEAIYADASCLAVLGILPLADSLDAACSSLENENEEYKKGINLLQNQMDSALKSLNVEVFGQVGEKFDPNLHNAIAHQQQEGEEQNIISAVFQKGYKMDTRIIRHAMVQVTN